MNLQCDKCLSVFPQTTEYSALDVFAKLKKETLLFHNAVVATPRNSTRPPITYSFLNRGFTYQTPIELGLYKQGINPSSQRNSNWYRYEVVLSIKINDTPVYFLEMNMMSETLVKFALSCVNPVVRILLLNTHSMFVRLKNDSPNLPKFWCMFRPPTPPPRPPPHLGDGFRLIVGAEPPPPRSIGIHWRQLQRAPEAPPALLLVIL